MSDGSTSQSLLHEAQAGSESAWKELQILYTPLIYYWCRRGSVMSGDAEEIWSNVLGRVAMGIRDFEHNGHTGAFRNWLKTITRNEILDYFQARQKTVSVGQLEAVESQSLEATDPSTERTILYHSAWEVIHGEFSERDNLIFRRVAEQGESAKNVAEDLGVKSSTVYTVVYRIKMRLRERFAGILDD